MNVVVDASVLVAAVADAGALGEWAIEVLSENHPTAPHIVLAEATNVLRRLERERKLSTVDAETACSDLLALDLVLLPYEPFARRIWSLRGNLTSYDAWYVALAEALECPLATLDRKLARAPGPACDFLLPA